MPVLDRKAEWLSVIFTMCSKLLQQIFSKIYINVYSSQRELRAMQPQITQLAFLIDKWLAPFFAMHMHYKSARAHYSIRNTYRGLWRHCLPFTVMSHCCPVGLFVTAEYKYCQVLYTVHMILNNAVAIVIYMYVVMIYMIYPFL